MFAYTSPTGSTHKKLMRPNGPSPARVSGGRFQERLRHKWLEWSLLFRRGFFATVTAAVLHGQEPKPKRHFAIILYYAGLSARIRESAVLAEVSAFGAFGRPAVRFSLLANRFFWSDQAPLVPSISVDPASDRRISGSLDRWNQSDSKDS